LQTSTETAAALDAGLGFFCHAFDNTVLQNPGLYTTFKNELIGNLAEIARFSGVSGCKTVGVEQMYSPHQIPWTINGARELIRQIGGASPKPLYITIDTGHQSGQRNFLKLTGRELFQELKQFSRTGHASRIWLGPDSAHRLLEDCRGRDGNDLEESSRQILVEMDRHPYLFAESPDSSTYGWLRELACYSPIIHLQQTDGTSSGHLPFTGPNNEKGLIEGRKVLEAIKTSYDHPAITRSGI
jgi:hypothetical protein